MMYKQQYSLLIQALQTGLTEALNMIKYYQDLEEKHTGKTDENIAKNVKVLKQLLIKSAKYEAGETVDPSFQ